MSSLFGNLGQNKPAAGTFGAGAFGNPATTNAQTGASPFGTLGAGTSQPQQSSNPFGGSLGGQTQQSTGFGAPPGPLQPAKPLLGFGAPLGQQQPQQTQATGGSKWGNFGASTAQTQQPAGSLFPKLGTSTAQPQASQQPAASNPFASSNAFGGQQQAQTQQQQPQSQQQPGGPLSQSTGQSQSAYFDHLLERGKKRNKQENEASQFGELPSLQLGLGDIARKVRNLGAGASSAHQARDSKAHYLLAASGVNTGATLKDLNSFKAQAGIGNGIPPPQAVDTDVDTYIANLQSQSTLAMIAEGLEQSKRDFDTFLENNVQMEWDAQRKRIYEHLGLSKPTEGETGLDPSSPANRGAFGKSSRRNRLGGSVNGTGISFKGSNAAKSVIGIPSGSRIGRGFAATDPGDKPGPGAQPENPLSRDKQGKFVEKIKDLNQSRDEGKTYPILAQLSEVELVSGTDTSPQLVDAYKACIYITGENPNRQPADPGAIRQRHYADAYLDENTQSNDSMGVRKQILNGSLKFLEQKSFSLEPTSMVIANVVRRFIEEVKSTVEKNRQEAAPGGEPTIINTVRAYIRLRANRRELGSELESLQKARDDYCWVLVFYLLRAGLLEDAVKYVEDNERAFKSFDRRFLEYLRAYAKDSNRRLPREKQASCSAEFKNRMQNPDLDPYRQACNKIVGRCDLTRRTLEGIPQGMDDWIWLQFNLAREVNRVEDSAGEAFGLDEVRSIISDIGQKHFPQGTEGTSGYAVFFFLQILAGMFEQAVNYLYQHNYMSAVHFGIALSYYGLLRASDFATSGSEMLTFTTRQKPQLNFARMVGLYTMDFRAARPEFAVEYLILIALNAELPGQAGTAHAEVCQEALRELVLETREFASLIGDQRNDGQRIKGAIQRRLNLVGLNDQDGFLRKLTLNAAHVADTNGRMTDAVLLYHLAEDIPKAFDAVLRVVYESLATDLGTPVAIEPIKPRTADADGPSSSSLSLLATEDPLQLGEAFENLRARDGNAPNFTSQTVDQEALLRTQLHLVRAKRLVEAGRWSDALDEMHKAGILPLHTAGSTSKIRQCVANATRWDYIMRNMGNFILWAILCCGRQREVLLGREYDNVNSRGLADQLLQTAKDLMVFAGLVRYKLSPRVYEALAEVGQDVGV